MLCLVFLFSYVFCEWVEIFQSHQPRLPFRKGSITAEFTTEGYFYKNSSISESHWDNGVIDRITNVGYIKQVPNPSVKSPSLKSRPNNIISKNKNATMKHNINTTVTLEPNAVTRFPVRSEQNKQIFSFNFNTYNKNRRINNNGLKNNLQDINIKTTVNSNHKLVHIDNDEDEHWIHVSNEATLKADENASKNTYKHQNLTDEAGASAPTYGASNLDLKRHKDINEHKNFEKHEIQTKGVKQVHNNVKVSPFTENNTNQKHPAQIQKNELQVQPTKIVNAVLKTDDTEKLPNFNINEIVRNETTNLDVNVETSAKLSKVSLENLKQNEDKHNILNMKPNIDFDPTYTDSVDGLLKMIKNIANTISINTRKGLKGKVSYLEDLRDTILAAIEARIEQAWPDDDGRPPSRRSARSAHERGHVEFPSSESALMTISFLTFAVFLIKLVLQVIHTYKSKAMMVTPAVVAAVGRRVTSFNNKN